MAGQDDALYAQAQQLFDRGDRAGAAAIASQLQSRGYRPASAAPAPAAPVPGSFGGAGTPGITGRAPAPAQAAPAPQPNADVPELIRNGGDQAVAEYRNAQRFRAAGNQAQSDLAAARAAAHVRATQMLGTITGGRAEAALLSAVPQGISNFIGRLTRPQGMSEAAFNEYSRTLHSALETARPASSLGGVVASSALIPELGAERLAANLGARGVTRVAARLGENAVVGGTLGAVAGDNAAEAGPGALLGAVGGEAGRVVGHGASFIARRFFPGRSSAAYRSISRALEDAQIQPGEMDTVANRIRQATGRNPSPAEILSAPEFAANGRGQTALNALSGIVRGNSRAAAIAQSAENEANIAAQRRAATNPHPETSRQSDVNFGAVADNPVDAADAASLLNHRSIGNFVRPRTGETGMVAEQTDRFHLANDVAAARAGLATAQAAQAAGKATPAVVNTAQQAVTRAEQAYAANPVTVNDLDALRQIVGNAVQKTGNTRIGETFRQQIQAIGDRATGGQYSQNIAAHAANATAEEEALARNLGGTRNAAPSASYDNTSVASHGLAAAGHALNGSPVGAIYHATSTIKDAARGVNPREAQAIARTVHTEGAGPEFAQRLERGRQQQTGARPTVYSRTGTIASRTAAEAINPPDNSAAAPTNDELYQQAQQLFDSGDRAGAQRIADQLKAENYVPNAPDNTADATSMPVSHDAAEALIRNREGFRAQPYNDAGGHPTIGYGHKIEAGESFPNGVTEAQAQDLMRQDIARTSAPLADLHLQLSDDQKHALVSFGYNAGPGALRRVVDAINSNGLRAGAAIMSRYTTSGGRHVSSLAARRQLEVRALTQGDAGV